MTVKVHIGRRVPNSWYRRTAVKVKGLMTFQENIWQIIRASLKKAKRKADADDSLLFHMAYDDEHEDLHYKIEWIKIIIKGTYEMEKEEYEDTLKIYDGLTSLFKKELPKDDNLSKMFKTKMPGMSEEKVRDAYKTGYGSVGDNNISNKLLEMGIMTHVEFINDHELRKDAVVY